MRVPRVLFFLACAATAAQLAGGCGGSDSTTTGATSTGSGGKTTTTASHSASHSSSAATGGTGPTSTSTGGAGGMAMSGVGNTCTADADCGMGLTCSKADAVDKVFGGGPANGYCTKACAKDTDCPSDSSCLANANGDKECILSCVWGMPPLMHINDQLDPTKCFGREDVRCKLVAMPDSGACLPTCGSDSDCPKGKHCDPRSVVCVDTPTAGDPLGTKCDAMAMMTNCSGICLNANGPSECSQACVIGGMISGSDCGGLDKGLCAYSPQGTGVGDEALCTPACNSQKDCQNPDWWCFGIQNLTGGMVKNGWCFDASLANACPKGDSDCKTPLGVQTKCFQTASGPRCLDPGFPPSGTGGSGGAGGAGTGGHGGAGGAAQGGAGGVPPDAGPG